MLRTERIIINEHTSIDINLYRDFGGALVLYLQEVEVDPTDPRVVSYLLGESWGWVISREKFPRCTKRIIEAFWNQHIGEARDRANARAEVVRNACTPSV